MFQFTGLVPLWVTILQIVGFSYSEIFRLAVILGLADRIAVLNYGELLVCDTPQNVINNPIVQSAYIGEAL